LQVDIPKDAELAIVVGATIVCALLGALVSYRLTLRVERRKQRIDKARAACQACVQLREILANWMSEITDATREEQSTAHVMKRLLDVFEHENYEGKVGDRIRELRGEPLCAGLLRKTGGFHKQAFKSKHVMAMALIEGKYARDYGRYRDDALQALRGVYDDFKKELEAVIPLLERKTRL
jgi:hypothetical protein